MTGRSTDKALVTIFSQQCEVMRRRSLVKAKTGGDCMQNPSDPTATYDAHKGQAFQVQIAETCSPENEVQLITGALPQSAAEPDGGAVLPMLDQLDRVEVVARGDAGRRPLRWRRERAGGRDPRRGVGGTDPRPRAGNRSGALTSTTSPWTNGPGVWKLSPRAHALVVERDKESGHDADRDGGGGLRGMSLPQRLPIHKTRDGRDTLEFTDKAHRLAGRRRDKRPRCLRSGTLTLGDRVDHSA